ncbi:hypothetical protein PoB_004209000 [Plakobranchus ocellatus]|uniref:Uncharacterized protein n=1 Tax=Plakobranchus ocellatus TaxID=259542 RepID=A0AAV4B909_9GAST|nr:hypothetical protein PoB_004209000 [Plakobranchus ocellatus]
MGRRARTNCSPVDSVLEKYHNDIGNRLSGVFMPPPNPEGGQPLCEDFSMLTLDIRRTNSVKNKTPGENNSCPVQKHLLPGEVAQSQPACTTTSEMADPPAEKETLSKSTNLPAHHTPSDSLSGQDCASRDKTRLVDKLTRALFQKKHICARCKRKSRTCVLNKTFNVTEKRYTCGRCRENSSALKNFFDGQCGEKQDVSSFSSLSSTSSPALKHENAIPQPRLGNDSGYETVTSCSTVASSYSSFNTPNGNKNFSKENAAPSNSATHSHQIPDCVDTCCYKSVNTTAPTNCHPSQLTNDNQLNVPQPCERRLARPADYDGYLPDFIEFRGWNRQMIRPCSQGDPPVCVDTGDCDETDTDPGPGIICVRRPSSLDSSPKPVRKACHTCGTSSAPCFRLPWEGGWLCEDCLDGIY